MTHPWAPWHSETNQKWPKSGQWLNSWKSPPFLDRAGIILYSLVYEITQSIKSNHSIFEAQEPLAFFCGVCLSLNKPTSYLKKKKKKDPRLVLSLFSHKWPPPFFPTFLSSHSVHCLQHCLLNFHNGLLDDILFFYLIFKSSFSPYPFYSFKLLMLTILSLYTQELVDKRTTHFVSMAVSVINF